MGSNNLAGSLIFIFEKSPWGQLNCRVANFFRRLSPMGSVIRLGQLIGSEEYLWIPMGLFNVLSEHFLCIFVFLYNGKA